MGVGVLSSPIWCCLVSESRSVMSDSLRPHGLYSPRNSPGQNTGVGSLSLLQGIFPTQGSNPRLPCCRQILYQLSHQGSPRCCLYCGQIGAHTAQETVLVLCFSQISERVIQLLAANKELATKFWENGASVTPSFGSLTRTEGLASFRLCDSLNAILAHRGHMLQIFLENLNHSKIEINFTMLHWFSGVQQSDSIF